MPHRVHRKDANHDEIVNALRGRGCDVINLASNQGDGTPDLLVLHQGDLTLIEIKTKTGKLTEAQERLVARGWPVKVCRTLEDVGRLFPLIEKPVEVEV